MDCSGLQNIGYQPLWGMFRNAEIIQVAFGSGDNGFVVLTQAEGIDLLARIRREGGATICDQTLSLQQAAELTLVLKELLNASEYLLHREFLPCHSSSSASV